MVDKTLTEVRTDNPAAAPVGTEPIESVQSSASTAFTFSELANSPLNAQVGTTYTLAITDQSKTVTMNNASANTLTIPLNATVAFHIGTKLIMRQIGAGAATLAATGGVTIEKATDTSLALSGAQEQLLLHKTATDTWHVAPMNPTAAGGGGSGIPLILHTQLTNTAESFSSSANATKGGIFTVDSTMTLESVLQMTEGDASATYKLMICEVSGATNIIDVILFESAVGVTNTADSFRLYIPGSPITLTSGKTVAIFAVRTDGTGASVCQVSLVGSLRDTTGFLTAEGYFPLANNNPVVTTALGTTLANFSIKAELGLRI